MGYGDGFVKGFVLMVAAGVAAVVAVVVAVLPVQVHDQGEVISCGPAVLDRSRFADLACADVFEPLQTLSVLLLVAAAIMIAYGTAALRTDQRRDVTVAHRVSAV